MGNVKILRLKRAVFKVETMLLVLVFMSMTGIMVMADVVFAYEHQMLPNHNASVVNIFIILFHIAALGLSLMYGMFMTYLCKNEFEAFNKRVFGKRG